MSALEKKIGLEVAVLKRTVSSKSQLLGIRESTSLAGSFQGPLLHLAPELESLHPSPLSLAVRIGGWPILIIMNYITERRARK